MRRRTLVLRETTRRREAASVSEGWGLQGRLGWSRRSRGTPGAAHGGRQWVDWQYTRLASRLAHALHHRVRPQGAPGPRPRAGSERRSKRTRSWVRRSVSAASSGETDRPGRSDGILGGPGLVRASPASAERAGGGGGAVCL